MEKRRRVAPPEFELLPQAVADGVLQAGAKLRQSCSSKIRIQAFFMVNDAADVRFEVIVHDFTGDTCMHSYTDMYIAGSHHHPDFFRAVFDAGLGRHPTKMENVNAYVSHAKAGKMPALTQEQVDALPDRFEAFLLPKQMRCLIIADARVLRCIVTHAVSDTVRSEYAFTCASTPDGDKNGAQGGSGCSTVNTHPMNARNFESECSGVDDKLWPYQLTRQRHGLDESIRARVQRDLDLYGVAVVPLAAEFLSAFSSDVDAYLKQLMKIPANKSLRDVRTAQSPMPATWLFREPKQFFSRHIRALSGRTQYGHFCASLKRLLRKLEFLLADAIGPLWVTTAEIRMLGVTGEPVFAECESGT